MRRFLLLLALCFFVSCGLIKRKVNTEKYLISYVDSLKVIPFLKKSDPTYGVMLIDRKPSKKHMSYRTRVNCSEIALYVTKDTALFASETYGIGSNSSLEEQAGSIVLQQQGRESSYFVLDKKVLLYIDKETPTKNLKKHLTALKNGGVTEIVFMAKSSEKHTLPSVQNEILHDALTDVVVNKSGAQQAVGIANVLRPAFTDFPAANMIFDQTAICSMYERDSIFLASVVKFCIGKDEEGVKKMLTTARFLHSVDKEPGDFRIFTFEKIGLMIPDGETWNTFGQSLFDSEYTSLVL